MDLAPFKDILKRENNLDFLDRCVRCNAICVTIVKDKDKI